MTNIDEDVKGRPPNVVGEILNLPRGAAPSPKRPPGRAGARVERDDESSYRGNFMQFDHGGVMAVAAGFEVKTSPDTARYHAFDRVRALAMLLGVVYHALLFPILIGGWWDPDATGPSSSPRLLGDWLHSFRMPLFFLIAGF